MRYQKIESRIWNDEKFIQLSPMQQRLFLYILTCPHGNLMGLFVLKEGYVCEDLKVSIKDFQKDLAKVLSIKLVDYDRNTQVLWIKNFLKHNPITNPNQLKSACRSLHDLPKTPLIQRFISANKGLFEGLVEGLNEGLSKPEAEEEADTYTDSDSYTDSETETEEKDVGIAPDKPARPPTRKKLTDEEWLAEIKRSPAYQGIDIDRVKGKMEAWCLTKGKQPSRARLLNWLNREDRPLLPTDGKPGTLPASRHSATALGMIEKLRQEKGNAQP